MRRLSLSTRIGIGGLGAMLIVAIVAPLVLGERADEVTQSVREGSSSEHLLGTDALGHDMLARTLVAARLTLGMATGATLLAVVIGTAAGTALALAGPRSRAVGERLIQLLIAFPPILVAIAITAIFRPSALVATVAIGVSFTPAFARMTNTLARSVVARDHVQISRLLGHSTGWILRKHVVPNVADTLLVLASVAFASAAIALSALGFLGLGVQPPEYDWGSLLSEALNALYTNPVQAVGPAVGILLVGLFAGLIGDGVAVALAPQAAVEAGERKPAGRGTSIDEPAAVDHSRAGASDGLLVENLRVDAGPGRELVRGVSLSIARGEIVGLVGESGSGKTLTAMSIARVPPAGVRVRADTLRLRDLDLLAAPPAGRLAADVAIVYQDPSASLNPVLRVGGQLTEVVRVHQGASAAQARESAIDALEAVRLATPERQLRRYPHELSGGMRQRVMIAGALMHEPALIVADEPTTALDVTVQAEVIDLLREANESRGAMILFISHDIAVVAQLCHRVLVMYAGEIVEELTAEQLAREEATHPYTRKLLAATPRLPDDVALMIEPRS